MLLLMIAGIGAIVAGAAAIWIGVPVKEFSFGNTMILAGTGAICSGLLLIALALVVRELKLIRKRLNAVARDDVADRDVEVPLLPAGSIVGRAGRSVSSRFEAGRPGFETASHQDDGGQRAQAVTHHDQRGAPPEVQPPVAEPAAPPPRRRNLLFSSSLRKREREGASSAPEVSIEPPPVAAAPAPTEADEGGPHPSFQGAWPGPERAARPEISASRRRALPADQTTATVVKSGTVDGMAYSLYSDGSIEAQLPEGLMRFETIDQLRAHLDRTT